MRPNRSFFCALLLVVGSWICTPANVLGGNEAGKQPTEVQILLDEYKRLLDENKSQESLPLLEKVLRLDPTNYNALSSMAGYYFLKGKKILDQTDAAYWALNEPTRMETAAYQDKLREIYRTYFQKAEQYVVKAYLVRRNDYLDYMAGEIATLKERIGITVPGMKRRSGFTIRK